MKPLVVLVNPLVGDPYEFTRENRTLPLGLLSVAGAIMEVADVRLVDQRMMPDWASRLTELFQRKPAMIGVHVMGGSQIAPGMGISRWIKRHSNAPLVWGGVFGTLAPEVVLTESAVDIVARGEGEELIPELVSALVEDRGLDDIDGVSFRRNGEVISTPMRELVDLEKLPELPYDLVDLRHYDWSAGINVRKDVLKLQIETSRGCLSQCIFCYNPFYNRASWRAQSAERTLERISHLVKDRGARYLDFIDDSYFEDVERARNIAKGMLDGGFAVPHLINGGKVEPLLEMPAQDLKLMAESGTEVIHIGAESGSDKVLDILRKGTTAEHIRQANVKLGKAGIIPSFYFLGGTPGETWEDLRQSMSLMMTILKENPKAKIISSFTFTPFLKTPGFALAKKHGMVEPRTLKAWSQFDTVRTAQRWLSPREQRAVSSLFFYTIWIDSKVEDLSPSPLVRAVAKIYRPIARWRLGTGKLGLPLDLWAGMLGLNMHRTLIRIIRWFKGLGPLIRFRLSRTGQSRPERGDRAVSEGGVSTAEDRP